MTKDISVVATTIVLYCQFPRVDGNTVDPPNCDYNVIKQFWGSFVACCIFAIVPASTSSDLSGPYSAPRVNRNDPHCLAPQLYNESCDPSGCCSKFWELFPQVQGFRGGCQLSAASAVGARPKHWLPLEIQPHGMRGWQVIVRGGSYKTCGCLSHISCGILRRKRHCQLHVGIFGGGVERAGW